MKKKSLPSMALTLAVKIINKEGIDGSLAKEALKSIVQKDSCPKLMTAICDITSSRPDEEDLDDVYLRAHQKSIEVKRVTNLGVTLERFFLDDETAQWPSKEQVRELTSMIDKFTGKTTGGGDYLRWRQLVVFFIDTPQLATAKRDFAARIINSNWK